MGLVAVGAVGPGEGVIGPFGPGEVFERSRRGLRLKVLMLKICL